MILNGLKIAGFFSVFAALLLLSNPQSASASAAENIRGVAYNSNYGYIIFNCLDDGFAGRFPFTFAFPFNIPPCTDRYYGVNLDANNNFSGNAWNAVLGFITFNASSTPSDAFRGKCNNGNTCTTASGCTACYNEEEEVVYGYMYVKDSNKWIVLDSSPSPTKISNYNAASAPGIFSGYASAPVEIGPISFNCTNEGTCIEGGTGTNDYRVKIGPTEIRQMIAPNWGSTEACSQGALQAILKWNVRSGSQTGYQVIVSQSDSTSTAFYNSGQINTAAKQIQVVLPASGYNKQYYWWLRLWDIDGPTAWRQFNTFGTKDEITNKPYAVGSDTKSFTSYKHEFPRPKFTWSPEDIIIATTSNSFVSDSYYYNDGGSLQPCTGSICKLAWSTTPSWVSTITSSTSASTSIMFTRATSTIVTLTSTDDRFYTCATSSVLDKINYALPLWKEVNATSTQ